MKDYIEIDGKQVQLPNLALGTENPFVVGRMKQLEEEKVRAEKKARLYFWAGIVVSVLCMFGGYLLGKFC